MASNQTSPVNEINIPLNVALFEGRHPWPSFIKEFVYDSKSGGYDPRDFEVFEGLAIIKFLHWKAKGVKAINLYLSGLVAATVAVLNAAYTTGIYVKLFHYSSVSNNWIPQLCDFLKLPQGTVLTNEEVLSLEKEERAKKEITDLERRTIVSYVNLFNELYTNYDPNRFCWKDVHSYIIREYKNIIPEYIDLMRPYFENEEREDIYSNVIRKRIEADRGKRKQTPILKLASKRRGRRR